MAILRFAPGERARLKKVPPWLALRSGSSLTIGNVYVVGGRVGRTPEGENCYSVKADDLRLCTIPESCFEKE